MPNIDTYRQPESSHCPTFSQLVKMLSRADFELFAWEEDLKGCDQRVKVTGAPLELAQNLYIYQLAHLLVYIYTVTV